MSDPKHSDTLRADVDEAIRRRDEEETARKLAALDAAIVRGLADVAAGRVHPAEEVFAQVRKKLGIPQKATDR